MSGNPLAACLVAAAFLAAHSPAAQAQPINIETWPDNVPCDVLKLNPDGSYEITVPFTRFFTVHNSAKYKNTRETRYWDQHCKGKTK
jgi:hypothetical protein